MSWFGETFGDSLNSLKGQITKITKEVLADDEAGDSEKPETSLKEYEALIESKDLEIAALREEFNKLHTKYTNEVEFLKKQSKSGNWDTDISENHNNDSELIELRKERDHLNSCLDELQSEYQVNLNQVISIRDKLKSELEELRKEHNITKAKLLEVSNSQYNSKQNETESSEIQFLKGEIDKLNENIKKERDENQMRVEVLIKDLNEYKICKEKLEKSIHDIDVINKIKQKTEEENKVILLENEDLKKKLLSKDEEIKEIDIKLKLIANEKEEILKRSENSSSLQSELLEMKNVEKNIQSKINELSQSFGLDSRNELKYENVIEVLDSINNKWKTHQSSNAGQRDLINNLQVEIKNLKEQNENLVKESKLGSEKLIESEKMFKDEVMELKSIISEMKMQRQDCINQSQTDDVKKLEQELAQYTHLLFTKNNEIKDYSRSIASLEQELQIYKTTSQNFNQELTTVTELKKKLEEEVKLLKNRDFELSKQKISLEEKLGILETENSLLKNENSEIKNANEVLNKKMEELNASKEDRNKMLEVELENVQKGKAELENYCLQLQKLNENLKNDFEQVKAQLIIKDTNLSELMKCNSSFQEEINKHQSEINHLQSVEREIKKWKEASVDLEIQRQDLLSKNEELENECLRLRSEIELLAVKDAEIEQLKQANSNLVGSCNQLHQELENKVQAEHFQISGRSELEKQCQKQAEVITELQDENNELKSRIQKFQEQIKTQMMNSEGQLMPPKEDVQQHRRSRSAAEVEVSAAVDVQKNSNESVELLKQAVQQEQAKSRLLQHQFQEISEKESSARKEFERLKQHLIEIEDHYTQEAVEDKKQIDELKSKLIAAEEQLQNSSTFYTSMKVRDNQHVESLQSQVRLITNQRDEFQAKLSSAEDEVQKHKASLMSLQIVLEQFQQDKEREIEEVAMKYEKQLQSSQGRFSQLEMEIDGLKKQLAEAKNGLKAASRLGEQLEKKTLQVVELEENLSQLKDKVTELEGNLASANQSNSGKIDKSLIKNLVVGYLLSPNGDRKSQVLRIMASVLEFDQDERNKMGVDSSSSGWLANILHPKSGGPPSNQSLSEAFIKFLENESRPQPQLKFHPEHFEAKSTNTPEATRASPKPSGRFSELMLPTFNSSQENESSVILKSVLKDS